MLKCFRSCFAQYIFCPCTRAALVLRGDLTIAGPQASSGSCPIDMKRKAADAFKDFASPPPPVPKMNPPIGAWPYPHMPWTLGPLPVFAVGAVGRPPPPGPPLGRAQFKSLPVCRMPPGNLVSAEFAWMQIRVSLDALQNIRSTAQDVMQRLSGSTPWYEPWAALYNCTVDVLQFLQNAEHDLLARMHGTSSISVMVSRNRLSEIEPAVSYIMTHHGVLKMRFQEYEVRMDGCLALPPPEPIHLLKPPQ